MAKKFSKSFLLDMAHGTKSRRVLAKLAKSEHVEVAYEVAKNPNTWADTLKDIADRHTNPAILSAVAANGYTPRDVQERLSKHPDSTVVQGLARNPNLLGSMFLALARHPDRNVRLNLAGNMYAPIEVHNHLAAYDTDIEVTNRAIRALHLKNQYPAAYNRPWKRSQVDEMIQAVLHG